MSAPPPEPPSQQQQLQPSALPPFTTHITTHTAAGPHSHPRSTLHASLPSALAPFDAARPTFNYSIPHSCASVPVQLSSDADLAAHASLVASGFKNVVLGGGGVNLRVLELPPGYESIMHRTISVDYGVVTEGELELVLEGGGEEAEEEGERKWERKTMKRGDLVVQRGTMHAWKNPSETKWARVVFVVVDAERLVVGDQELREQWGLE